MSVSGTGTLLFKVVRAFLGSMASITSAPERLVLEPWLEAFSLPLLTLKKQGAPCVLEPITIFRLT